MVNTNFLNFYSFNARGLAGNAKRRCIFNWLKGFQKGIHFVQETHSTIENENSWQKEWDGSVFFSHGTSRSKGVAILFSKGIDFIVNDQISDSNGRFLLLDVDMNNDNFLLLNVYAPTQDSPHDQMEFIKLIESLLLDKINNNIILCGDFNTYLNTTLDKSGRHVPESLTEYSQALTNMTEEMNLIDIWRILNPDVKRYTWRGHTKNGFVQSRLDYFFISSHMIYDVQVADIAPSIKSDHSLLKLSFNLKPCESRGKGFWKFNNSLLSDNSYVVKVKQIIVDNQNKYSELTNKSLLWDVIKCEIRSYTISYSSYIAKQKRSTIDGLYIELSHLEKNLNNTENIDRYNDVKHQLEALLQEKTNGLHIRSRAIHIDQNEKSNKYFLKQEIKNSKAKHIKCLKTDDNRTISTHKEILNEQKRFYQNLYTQHNKSQLDDNCEFLRDLAKLNETDKDYCENMITIDECSKALKELSNGKSPGSDGFTTEFYKFFWINIKDIVYNSFIYAYENGVLSIEQRRAVLTLLPKIGKDHRYLKNWRPLSLLNTDYKILAKVLASRMQRVIKSLVKDDQVAYIKGRYIGENIRKISDVFEYCSNKIDPGIALFLDFEKAFDTINWQYLVKCLDCFNFGEYFTNWIKILYKNPMCTVINYGHATEFFQLSRGIRQGCPISALLFLLVAETMANRIRNTKGINPVNINGCTVGITQMADDTTLFLKDLLSVSNALNLLERFSKVSGLNLNKDKTEAVFLGLSTKKISDNYGIKWVRGPIKVLGIWVGDDREVLYEKNIINKIQKVKSLLGIWNSRNLSIKGKITVLKSLVMPILIYPFSLFRVKPNTLNIVDRMFFNFVWPSGKHHVKKNVLIQNIEEGGLKMPDIFSMIKANRLSWINRFMKANSFSKLVGAIMGIGNMSLYIKSKQKFSLQDENFAPGFYKEILCLWSDVYCKEPSSSIEIANEYLWDNEFIKINNAPIHFKVWETNGISHIKDILTKDCAIITRQDLQRLTGLIIPDMQYNSFISAIPKSWIRIIDKNDLLNDSKRNSIFVKLGDAIKSLEKLCSKDFYTYFISLKTQIPTAVHKWESLYPEYSFDWKLIYQNPYQTTSDTNLQSFQYKIINRFMACNSLLSIWKKREHSNCNHCNEIDTIEHHLYQCIELQHFWTSFLTWWKNISNVNIKLHICDIIFCIPNFNDDPTLNCMNTLILFAKKYIYDMKLNENVISFTHFINLLKKKLDILRTLSRINDNYDTFITTWHVTLDYFES